MDVLLIDNYDSFVFNLSRYLQELGVTTRVIRNDELSCEQIGALAPVAIVLSPGPCTPAESGVCRDVIRQFYKRIPILGVCLGHQAIGDVFGAKVLRADEPVHGRTSLITHTGDSLFRGCPNPLEVARYHSLIVEEQSLPAELRVTARTADHIVMSIEHIEAPLFGVQFHPESILTTAGHLILANFLHVAGLHCRSLDAPGDLVSTNENDGPDFYRRPIAIDAVRPM